MTAARVIHLADRRKPNQSELVVWVEVSFMGPDDVGYRMLERSSQITNSMLVDALRTIAQDLEKGNDNDAAGR